MWSEKACKNKNKYTKLHGLTCEPVEPEVPNFTISPFVKVGKSLNGSGEKQWNGLADAIKNGAKYGNIPGKNLFYIQNFDNKVYYYGAGDENGISGPYTWNFKDSKDSEDSEDLDLDKCKKFCYNNKNCLGYSINNNKCTIHQNKCKLINDINNTFYIKDKYLIKNSNKDFKKEKIIINIIIILIIFLYLKLRNIL